MNDSDEKQKRLARIIIFLVVPVLIVIILILLFTPAFAQQPPQQILKGLEQEGLAECEVVTIYRGAYTPFRIELTHEPVNEQLVKVSSTDPKSSVIFEKRTDFFAVVTNSTDAHEIRVILDYSEKHQEPRQVFYRYIVENNIVAIAGNWRHEGFQFCKIFSFWAEPAPHITTKDEMIETFNEFQIESFTFLGEKQQETINFIAVFAIISTITAGGMAIALMLLIMTRKADNRRTERITNSFKNAIQLMIDTSENNKFSTQINDLKLQNGLTKLKDAVTYGIKDMNIVLHGLGDKTFKEKTFVKPTVLTQELPETEKPTGKVLEKLGEIKDKIEEKLLDKKKELDPKDIEGLINYYTKRTREQNTDEFEKLRIRWIRLTDDEKLKLNTIYEILQKTARNIPPSIKPMSDACFFSNSSFP